jgi:hypothetical protein
MKGGSMIGVNRRRVMGKKSILPQGFIQLEYIKGTGSQYINTGVKPTVMTDCEFTFSLTTLPTGVSFINGSQQSKVKPYNYYVFMNANASMQIFRYGVNSASILNTNIKLDSNIHTIKVRTQRGLYIFDSQEFPLFDTLTYNQSIGNIFLFALNEDGLPKYAAKIKIYKFIITDNILVRNFIPCISPENIVGMYDLVEGKFYSSPNGAAFIAGPEI